MKHTDYYKQIRELKAKERKELAAALRAHGGSYTWKDPEDESNEGTENLPCIGFNLDGGPRDVIVYRATVDDHDFITITGAYIDDFDIDDFDACDAFAAHIDFLIEEIPETDEVSDVTLPQEYFNITSVHRDDLKERGFDTSKITDAQMRDIARRLGDAYVENGFWIDLDIIADYLEIPKRKQDE